VTKAPSELKAAGERVIAAAIATIADSNLREEIMKRLEQTRHGEIDLHF
jgi:2-iminoacetate synthase